MPPPTADEVREQVERMLASPPFAASPRLRTFLRYVVDRTLEGQGGQLKEYAIGVDVFQRDGQYDPRIDSIVRVEAGRLRAKVDEYYGGEGALDLVVVRIPRGGYMPLFETREPAAPLPPPAVPAAETPQAASPVRWPQAALLLAIVAALGIALWGPVERGSAPPSPDFRVAVLPFTHYAPGAADEALAARITDGVTTELARLDAVAVVSRTSAMQFGGAGRRLPEIANLLNAAEVIEGSVVSDGEMLRVSIRTVNGRTDVKTGVREFEGRRDRLDELIRRIAESLTESFKVRRTRR